MNKNTFLVWRQDTNGARSLEVASKEEWNEILQHNRTGPLSERRYFIRDCVVDGQSVDSIFIEVTEEEYKEWHRKEEIKRRRQIQEESNIILSLNAKVSGAESEELINTISCGADTEKEAMTMLLLQDLEQALDEWKPWAKDLLHDYLKDTSDHFTLTFAKRCGVSVRTAQRRCVQFERFVEKFLSEKKSCRF